jgi:hypothetical protein
MHKGHLERGMLKQWPTFDNISLNRYQVSAQVDHVELYFIQAGRHNIAELYDLHSFESFVKFLQFTDCLQGDYKYLLPVAESVQGGVRGPNPTQRDLNAVNVWTASAGLPGGRNPTVYLNQILSSGE